MRRKVAAGFGLLVCGQRMVLLECGHFVFVDRDVLAGAWVECRRCTEQLQEALAELHRVVRKIEAEMVRAHSRREGGSTKALLAEEGRGGVC